MTTNTDPNYLYIHHSGPGLIETPLLNKGSAFTQKERESFNLAGLLPPRYETIEEQVERCYQQYSSFKDNLNKHIYLRAIQDNNETLYYRLVRDHLEEMLPIIYTPTVGDACEKFSDIYRSARGLFISYEDRYQIDDILRNATKGKVKVIVVTDGERILGLGDQGIGGMGIPIGKLSLYTACGGISPAYTLPVMLDVGTNNEKLLNDPMYMGARHKRIAQDEYDEFLDLFIKAVKRRWPNVLLQFEDFAQPNAMPLLKRYRDEICSFNDDIQGTAAVTVGSLLAACRVKSAQLSEQKVVFVGAGSAGCGIAEQIITQMVSEGISDEQARSQVFMVDRFGLLTQGMEGLRDFQQALAQPTDKLADWTYSGEYASLLDVMHCTAPDILIGVSGQPGLFTEQVIRAMHNGCEQPVIFPLSNPSKQVEALPEDVINWTQGKAIVATGSPFAPVVYDGETFVIPQCNNSYIFPGIGLGVIAAKATRITDAMLMVSSEILAESSPRANTGKGSLLPALTEIETLSKRIAFGVAKKAIEEGAALEISDDMLWAAIDRNYWLPKYRNYKRCSI
ncbi:MAG: malate dehydrogenase (oxaloacetate-decarboxylating) [Pseudoalteromonas rhizosphaerae]|jgi:malate dehydrogenase (oxaloacetate-decarboxylating)|uniref:NAD-dependent malic enzyme n=1 Tax=Pseudoalteromonas neustonica TaxID=1840331 RepID=A0ABY3FJ28_9GAMM|nr:MULTISPECIES: NAD-dependent malic enzyme [Pseudoalteromonas]MBB1294839.1 NAD-dependent malic enzyme [Pseudoalteromonas sp. SR41-4]MBB1302675.1 NAD-dependent malic enzyme [Pseudoalteromonas sp. SR44-8]MBB1399145.1 NAD-dependent malic enzyme [Pseudoalteromonas sp. SG44-8]MBB1503894.1 NAD-dependent malic enzyme [Pseudoalteromonas sp. SG41-1]TVU86622.1 NAD-dependent malic enzyme [Pseudoalteromonas neustonica]|tara:strand:+ start:12594 stop:14288 length:1695 start_codon:yes stop_codon:yes gene_type:complete